MTLTFELDLVGVKLNQQVKYLCQRSFDSSCYRDRNRHTRIRTIALPGPPKWSLTTKHDYRTGTNKQDKQVRRCGGPIAIDVACTVVCVRVCVCVLSIRVSVKKTTERTKPQFTGADSRGSKESCIRWG